MGRLTGEERDYIPETERSKVFRTARIWLAIYAMAAAAAIVLGSWLPLVLVGGPRLYGTFMHIIYGLTQHAGMGEDVLDHRLNTRTVHMNVINRFLYWNMNYHVEHHMFPMVPYHRLPSCTRRSRTISRPPTRRCGPPTRKSSRRYCARCATRRTSCDASCLPRRPRSTSPRRGATDAPCH